MTSRDLHEPDQTDVGRRSAGVAAGLFAVIAILVGLDLLSDAGTGVDLLHLVAEGAVMLLALAGAMLLWRHLRSAEARAGRLQVDLDQALVDAARYRAESQTALAGLGDAIDAQFGRWALTPAEREVGLLLLKGLSHRDVAGIRDTSERPSGSRRWPSTASRACAAAPSSPRSSWRICCCRRPTADDSDAQLSGCVSGRPRLRS